MKLTKTLTAAAIALAMAVPAARAATVDATVNPAGISVGDFFTIELEANATASESYTGFQTPLSWDGAFVNLTGIAFHSSFDVIAVPGLPGGPFTSPLPVLAGTSGTALSGAQTLATFTFEALAEGSTDVTFAASTLDDGFLTGADGDSLFDGPVVASVNIDAASTDPNVVPLPASLLLLLGGLFGLGMFGRKRV